MDFWNLDCLKLKLRQNSVFQFFKCNHFCVILLCVTIYDSNLNSHYNWYFILVHSCILCRQNPGFSYFGYAQSIRIPKLTNSHLGVTSQNSNFQPNQHFAIFKRPFKIKHGLMPTSHLHSLARINSPSHKQSFEKPKQKLNRIGVVFFRFHAEGNDCHFSKLTTA